MHPKDNYLNIKENLEDRLLNQKQKQAPNKKY